MASCLPDNNTAYHSAVSPLGRSGLVKQENSSSLSPTTGLLTVVPPSSGDYIAMKQDELLTASTDEPLRASVSENVFVSMQQPGQYLVDTSSSDPPQNVVGNWSSSSSDQRGPTIIASTCAVCHEPIYSRYLLVVLGVTYHEACLRCSTCHLPLIEVGNKCYRNRAGANICEKDYALIKQQQCQQSSPYLSRNSGNLPPSISPSSSACNSCFRLLQPNDWVTSVHDKKYHADCFACCVCRQRLLKGSSFVMVNNQIWCEKDYHGLAVPGPMMTLHHHPDAMSNSPVPAVCGMAPQQQLY